MKVFWLSEEETNHSSVCVRKPQCFNTLQFASRSLLGGCSTAVDRQLYSERLHPRWALPAGKSNLWRCSALVIGCKICALNWSWEEMTHWKTGVQHALNLLVPRLVAQGSAFLWIKTTRFPRRPRPLLPCVGSLSTNIISYLQEGLFCCELSRLLFKIKCTIVKNRAQGRNRLRSALSKPLPWLFA